MNKNIRTSKFLSLVLRHDPGTIGLTLDREGWADVTRLLELAGQHGVPIDRALLTEIVAEDGKQRFRFSDDGVRIRASQGHSIEIDLKLTAVEPPEFLYHGTVERFLESIRREGLRRMKRHHVHLSADRETAQRVGERRGKPVVLKVAAGEMAAQGVPFFCSDNGVWLVDAVPTGFLHFPDED